MNLFRSSTVSLGITFVVPLQLIFAVSLGDTFRATQRHSGVAMYVTVSTEKDDEKNKSMENYRREEQNNITNMLFL